MMYAFFSSGLFVASIGYLCLLFFEYARPGFVSYIFSPHWFLIVIFIFLSGLMFSKRPQESQGFFSRTLLASVLFLPACVFAVVLFKEGAVFGDARFFLAVVGFVAPYFVLFVRE